MYERHNQPLISQKAFIRRMLTHTSLALGLVIVSLGAGILGYHFLENLPWIDALLNASMILGGMGPVNALTTDAGKIFASLYALFSGMVFLVVAGLLVAPVAHRILHRMHLDK
jgi:hypothetical protein